MLWKLWKWMMNSCMFLMMFWRRQVPRVTKCCIQKPKLRCQKELEKFTSDEKTSERKWSERKRNLHPLVTRDTDSLSRELSNKRIYIHLKNSWLDNERQYFFLNYILVHYIISLNFNKLFSSEASISLSHRRNLIPQDPQLKTFELRKIACR
jgi:hypothetical protein